MLRNFVGTVVYGSFVGPYFVTLVCVCVCVMVFFNLNASPDENADAIRLQKTCRNPVADSTGLYASRLNCRVNLHHRSTHRVCALCVLPRNINDCHFLRITIGFRILFKYLYFFFYRKRAKTYGRKRLSAM